MNRDHHEKLARVNAWLRTTFDGDRIPPFQASEANIERLYALCCLSEQRDAELSIVAEAAQQMQKDYSDKAIAISSELAFAGLNAESLPPNVAENVNCLVSFAASIGCEDCNEATLCCALEELEQRRVNVEDSLAAERNRQQAIRDYTSDVSVRLQELRLVVEGLASDTENLEVSAATSSPLTSQMEEKCRDYTQRLIALKSQLASVGARPEIYHEALVRMGHELVTIQKQCKPLLAKLDSYKELPADQTLARVQVERVRMEVQQLDARLDQMLGGMVV